MSKLINNAIGAILMLTLLACTKKPVADLLLFNGTIYIADSAFSTCTAMAIKDGKVIATGGDELRNMYEYKKQTDLKRQFVYPGFIDGHCHFYGYGTDLPKCALFGTSSFKDVIDKVVEYEKNNHFHWLLGRGWDQNDWQVKEFPDKSKLDSLFTDKPVFLLRIDGHAALVNQKALDLAGITAQTKIDGGEVVISNAKPTGILIDNAVDLVKKIIPGFTPEIKKNGLLKGQQNCFAVGLTSVMDAGLKVSEIEFIDSLQKAGLLKMKIYALAELTPESMDYWFAKGIYKTDRLHVRGFKLYADGALGSRGACLLQPYSDSPGRYGFLLTSIKEIEARAKAAYDHGFQLCTHCIGDSANRLMLNIYAGLLQTKNDRRWRIEHCQVVNHNDQHLFGDFSIIPSVQPTHATSDMYWAENRLGSARIKDAYAYNDLLKTAGLLVNGSDFPVEDINPLYGFYAAVVRKDQKGFPEGGFEMNNAITRKEALLAMTRWAAYGMFEEKEKGSLEAGKDADFVILNSDLMTAPENSLYAIKVQETYINGTKVFDIKD